MQTAPTRGRRRRVRATSLAAAAGAALALGAAAPPALADACPNAVVRAEQKGSLLPECRAYELVSPAHKNGNSLFNARYADPAGGGVVFNSSGAFADAASSVGANYFARRTDRGWVTRSYNFPTLDRLPVTLDEPVIEHAGGDLARAIVSTTYPLDPDDQGIAPGYNTTATKDVFRREADGGFTWLSRPARLPDTSAQRVDALWTSDDGQHVLLWTRKVLAEPVEDESRFQVYLVSGDGPPRLVSALEDGRPGAPSAYTGLSNYVSADGSRVIFKSGNRLLGRFDAHDPARARTREVGVGADGRRCTTGSGAHHVALSPDGSQLLFTCPDDLTGTASAAGTKLYLRHLDTGDIAYIGLASTASARGMSDDFSIVWLAGNARLTPDAPTSSGLYLLRHGRPSYVAPAVPADNRVAASPDGEHLAFATDRDLGFPTGGREQVYRASAATGEVVCVSCRPDGTTSGGAAELSHAAPYGLGGRPARITGLVSPDGRRIFFTSADALVPHDRNGVLDAYAWIDGRVHLISSGTHWLPSSVVNASVDGRDVFFITGESLVPQDIDNGVADVYTARIGGGIPAPPPPTACTSDCRGPLRQPPDVVPPGTFTHVGPGDVEDAAEPGTAKAFRVTRIGARQRRALARRGRAVVRVRVRHATRARIVVRARIGRRMVRVGAAERRAGAGGTVRLPVRLDRRARRQLRRTGALRITVRVTCTGMRGAQTTTFVVRTPARGGRR